MLPWSAGKTSPDAALLAVDSWGKLFKYSMKVMLLPNVLLLSMAVFTTMAAIHYMVTLLPIFTIQELGWNNIFYAKIFSTSNLVGGIIGMLIGGLVIKRFGIIRFIQCSLFFTSILTIALALSISFWKDSNFISSFIAIYCALRTAIYIGVLALAMHLCWRRISAIQFTFCMTIFNAGLSSGAAFFGFFRSFLDWQMLFIVFVILIIVSMIILNFIKTTRHIEQVNLLERDYLQVLKTEATLLVKSEPA